MRCSDLLGVKGAQADRKVNREILMLNIRIAFQTTCLEYGRSKWNSQCSGEMRRY